MKKILFLLLLLLGVASAACAAYNADNAKDFYKLEMQKLLRTLGTQARSANPAFGILANGGTNLYYPPAYMLNKNSHAGKAVALVDGIMIESLNFGYGLKDGSKTPGEVREYFLKTVELAKKNNVALFNIDYCKSEGQKKAALKASAKEGFLSFAAKRGLDELPAAPLNDKDIASLKDCENFCVILNPHKFASKENYLDSLRKSNYDLLIIDGFYGLEFYSAAEIASLQKKPNGRRRLLYCYMSLGEAESYRWYWREEYKEKRPEWMDEPNADWQGSYKAKYWLQPWHDILYNASGSYLSRVLGAGFDGVFFDCVDAFEYFQAK